MHFLLRDSESQGSESPHSVMVPEPSCRITNAGQFDLDDLGAKFGQLRRREWASQEGRNVQNATPLQGLNVQHHAAPWATT